MSRKNRGSILITTLMILSIIAVICVSCLGLAYSNGNVFCLEYKYRVLKENSLSGVEITRSNILSEVKNALLKCKNKEEFSSYFLGNNQKTFCDRITNLNKSELSNVNVRVDKNNIYQEDGSLNFQVISDAKDNNYSRKVKVSVKIINPFKQPSIEEGNISNEESNLNSEEINISNKENNSQQLNEKDLVIIENYREM